MLKSITSRPYASAADLRKMQAAVSRAYATTTLRVGDVAWVSRYHTHRELTFAIRLWEDQSGKLVGWTYLRARGGFNLFVAPGCSRDDLLDEMLAVILAAADASERAGDPPVGLYTYGIDVTYSGEDRALAAVLERHGFKAQPGDSGVLTRSLEDIPMPVLPPGYRLDWLRTREQLIGRVEAQRAAFAPSDLLLERYVRVQQRWPYRPELDRIVVTDDGEVVAFCLAWIDEENAAGQFRAGRHTPGSSATRACPRRLSGRAPRAQSGRCDDGTGRVRLGGCPRHLHVARLRVPCSGPDLPPRFVTDHRGEPHV